MEHREALGQAIDDLYCTHRQQFFTCAVAVTCCPDRAEDAIQDAFYRLYRLDRIPENLQAYAFRSVRNAAINQLRRNKSSIQKLPEDIFDNGMGPVEQVASDEFKRRVASALAAISKDEREMIMLHLYAKLTFREISEVHDIPIATAATRYRRGLEKLRVLLKEE